jgi:uncharacterized protein
LNNKQTILQQIKQAALEVDPSAQVILFGSQARGDVREESDWDILVLTGKPVDAALKQLFLEKFMDIQLDMGISIGAIIRTKTYWDEHQIIPLFREISKEGVVL